MTIDKSSRGKPVADVDGEEEATSIPVDSVDVQMTV